MVNEKRLRRILQEELRDEEWRQMIEELLEEEEEKNEGGDVGFNYWTVLRDVYDPKRRVWRRIKKVFKYVGLVFLGFLIFIIVICIVFG